VAAEGVVAVVDVGPGGGGKSGSVARGGGELRQPRDTPPFQRRVAIRLRGRRGRGGGGAGKRCENVGTEVERERELPRSGTSLAGANYYGFTFANSGYMLEK
jgi:hypothetical protein